MCVLLLFDVIFINFYYFHYSYFTFHIFQTLNACTSPPHRLLYPGFVATLCS